MACYIVSLTMYVNCLKRLVDFGFVVFKLFLKNTINNPHFCNIVKTLKNDD